MENEGIPDSHDPAQTALGIEPMARVTDPETSHEAARSVEESANNQRRKVLGALRIYGPMTADELDRVLSLRATSAGRRLPELQRLGKVEPTDETRMTRSGRSARVWRAR